MNYNENTCRVNYKYNIKHKWDSILGTSANGFNIFILSRAATRY